jgi:hypothetical protein
VRNCAYTALYLTYSKQEQSVGAVPGNAMRNACAASLRCITPNTKDTEMIAWSNDKLKKEIAKGAKRQWEHLPQLEAELARRERGAAPLEKVLAPKLVQP